MAQFEITIDDNGLQGLFTGGNGLQGLIERLSRGAILPQVLNQILAHQA